MNRSQRAVVRASQDAARQARAEQAAAQKTRLAQREAAIQKALSRAPRGTTWDRLADSIGQKAPRLAEAYPAALAALRQLPRVRSEDTWEPRGKGRDALFRSLCDHMFAKYPTPSFLWSVFHTNNRCAHEAVVHIARGGALYDLVKSGDFPVPLTRRMCHDFLQTTGHTFFTALRKVQVKAVGGDARLFTAWRSLLHTQGLGTRAREAFWFTVLEWFAKAKMLDLGQIGPICDYIAHRYDEDETFSMKGRSALAVLRGVQEWHGTLAKVKSVKSTLFKQSGWKEGLFDDYARREPSGTIVKETWRVQEILSARGLYEEGRRMGHCVYSYAGRVEHGDTSIWSMTMEDGLGETGNWAMLTIEVRNDLRRIVQARGRFNRERSTREQQVLTRWAGLNSLEISLGTW